MRKVLTTIVLLVNLTGFGQDNQPPDCKKIPKTDTIHGKVLTDNYYWLKDTPNSGTR